MKKNLVLGIDIGGSGVKGAVIDIERGCLVAERYRIPTPRPARPEKVYPAIASIAAHFSWRGIVGCGFPGVIRRGVTCTAANLDEEWVGRDTAAEMSSRLNTRCMLINDADAAALAEMRYGAGRGYNGMVCLITVGTGLGTSFFYGQTLFPNTELGHLVYKNTEAEHYASDAVREQEGLSWRQWADRFNEILSEYERLFNPDLFVIGGGVVNKRDEYWTFLRAGVAITPALLGNHAGMIGAAVYAAEQDDAAIRGQLS